MHVKSPATGLADLARISLDPLQQGRFDSALARAHGEPMWKQRKAAELRDVLALAQVAPTRLQVEFIEAADALRVGLALRVPVPVWNPEREDVELREFARIGVTYPRRTLLSPQAGFSFAQIIEPHGVFHAQVGPVPGQPLCLGARLPVGIPLREIVWLSYTALSMQSVMLDALDPAGVMNAPAARWWQGQMARLPLSAEPFLAPRSADGPLEAAGGAP